MEKISVAFKGYVQVFINGGWIQFLTHNKTKPFFINSILALAFWKRNGAEIPFNTISYLLWIIQNIKN